MKHFYAYGKEKGRKNFHFVDVIKGKNQSSARRTFKKMSKWSVVKIVPVIVKRIRR